MVYDILDDNNDDAANVVDNNDDDEKFKEKITISIFFALICENSVSSSMYIIIKDYLFRKDTFQKLSSLINIFTHFGIHI